MILSLFGRKKSNLRVVKRQYEAITKAARHPHIYRHWNVPDTVMGRFELISLHMVLYFRNSRRADEAAKLLAQEILEAFFEDIDHSIRELGIGDAGVSKRIKKLGKMFYGRAKSYEEALNAGDNAALAEALKRNIHPNSGEDAPNMDRLGNYVFATDQALAGIDSKSYSNATVTFPEPDELVDGNSDAGRGED